MTKEILSKIQESFPLVVRPFRVIGDELGISEDRVIKILTEQKEAGIIRQTSAIFDTKRLGYKSSLVAFKISKDDINNAVKILNSHPGISHNYERNHDFNVWFTMAVEPESKFGLEKTVELLAKLCNCTDYIILPTLKLFKISVKLNTTGKDKQKEKVKIVKHKEIKLTPMHQKIIEASQYDIDITKEPFKKVIDRCNVSYEHFFEILNELKDAGVMRRFASILNHRKAGFNANAMVVWDVDEKNSQSIGETAASFSAVSHCYIRPKYPNWPYNLFTMIHGKTTDETNAVIDSIAKEIQSKIHMSLYSTREFKKVRIEYFTSAFKEWEDMYS
ncbi:MAG: Lrp/AsnC family transcriptional regulator [Epsilonproteobacteria bacterium]|nr:Lrp/AsnC family transcriptional regulator [Campylobacterota bacterium]